MHCLGRRDLIGGVSSILLDMMMPAEAAQSNERQTDPRDNEQDIQFASNGAVLSGTLVKPENEPTALITMVHGSGKVERMLPLARGLAREGFAVFTYDKRGTGQSAGSYHDVGFNDGAVLRLLADDAAAALSEIVRYVPRVRAGFIGISQAGWIVPIAAAKSNNTNFIGLWSGPVCTLGEQLYFQDMAGSDSNFWTTHTKAQVADLMRSAPKAPDDADPIASLSSESIPGMWIYGDHDNLIPVDVSIQRLQDLIRQGHSEFQYKVVPGGHNLVDSLQSDAFRTMVNWLKQRS